MSANKGGEVELTIQRMIELLEIEHECMLHGAHDDCDRDCANCELVQDDGDLHEMYTDVIALLKEQDAIVRCKDCTYLNADTGICIVGIPHGHKETFHCAYGKRR